MARPAEVVAEDQVGGWTFGGGIYIMRPFFESNPAFILFGDRGAQQVNFSQHASVTPLTWIGFTWDSGWGFRARWFEYSSTGRADATVDSSTTTAFSLGGIPLPYNVIDASSNLNVNVFDFESTYQVDLDRWTLLTSGGVRYAHMSQWSQVLGLDNTGSTLASTTAYHNFNGVGPTIAFEGRRRIGDFGFALYGSARGSILFGSSVQNATYTDISPSEIGGSNSQACLLTIGEFELGAEWRRKIGRYSIFTQTGIMGQVWFGGGNASEGQSLISNYIIPGVAQSNFGFFGGVVRLGVSY